MADKVLYFPYIRVPENEWFMRVLLYWDEIGSIVPSDYINRPEMLGNYMGELVQTELVTVVQPGRYIHEVPNFEGAFLNMINQNQTITQRRLLPLERRENFRIHIEKFSRLVYDLCDMGLAREVCYPWYEVERLTADLFMAYLASVLGKSEHLQMEPITDHAKSLFVYSTSPENVSSPTDILHDLRIGVLEGILPAPAVGIPVSDLVEFKNRHCDSLSAFRRHIESSLIDIALISNKDLRDEKVRLFRDGLREQIDEIRARMHERHWPPIVLGAVAAAMPLAGTLATCNIPLALLGLPPIAIAIYSAYSGKQRKQREILSSPLAYAALVDERFANGR